MTKTSILLIGSLFAFGSLTSLGCTSENPSGNGGGGSGGEASSSSSSSSGSSSSGMGGSGGESPAAAYCTAIMKNCTAANAQWPDAKSCENAAADFPPGTAADMKGDTLGCRQYHATAAAGMPDVHCVHAGPAGGGAAFCGDTCEGFCDIAVKTCAMEWPDKTACMTACALIPTAVMNYSTAITSGNTIECRLYHLSVAATDAASATAHCPHTKAVTMAGDPCGP